MNFCSGCGGRVALRVPPGDDRARHVCEACGTVHYQNPKIVAGCIPEWGDRVLLCRRAIEPRRGRWTVPAGFMERGETTEQAAARETLEEANARVEIGELFCYLDIPRIDQVYVIFRSRLLDLDFHPGPESLETRLFAEQEIPWPEVAFPSVEVALERYFADRERGTFRMHTVDITWRVGEPRPDRPRRAVQ